MNNREQVEVKVDPRPTDGAFYVYCIAETVEVKALFADSLPLAIEDNAGLELISADDFAAVTSRVPLSMYGEDSLNENLSDASWTALRAMRHERVVEHFAKRTSVVPLRFGTIYLERNGIEFMLVDASGDLKEIITRIRGCEEWGVNVFSDRQKLLEAIVGLSPRLRDLSQLAQNASPGQAYLLQKKVESLRTDEARVILGRMVDEVEANLLRKTKAGKRLRLLKVESTENGDLKAKFAFLVEKSAFDNFREEAERLANEMNAAGIRLELTGPWPVYNFTSDT